MVIVNKNKSNNKRMNGMTTKDSYEKKSRIKISRKTGKKKKKQDK